MLGSAGVRYIHVKALAPSDATREAQHQVDREASVSKRFRTELSQAFIVAYDEQLRGEDAQRGLREITASGSRPVLLCVEQAAGACHRSLAAGEIQRAMGVRVEHLSP